MVGDIIKKQRLALNLPRRKLAEGICSEKHIYLIENNERNPSANILNGLSDRLGLDLFSYYQYSGHENKEQIMEHRRNFSLYVKKHDFKNVKIESERASKLSAFQEEPFIYDVKIADIYFEIIVQRETKKAIKELEDILNNKEITIDPITLVYGYIALAISYIMENQLNKAQDAITIAYQMVEYKTRFPRYNTAIITVYILYSSLLYLNEEYQELIEHSKLLRDFQEEHCELNRTYYVDFYLSFAYYHMDKYIKSKDHFIRAVSILLLFENKEDIRTITQMKDFSRITQKLKIDSELTDKLYSYLEE